MAEHEISVQDAERISCRLIKTPRKRKKRPVITDQTLIEECAGSSYTNTAACEPGPDSVSKQGAEPDAEKPVEDHTDPSYASIFTGVSSLTLRGEAQRDDFFYEPLPDARKWIRLLRIQSKDSPEAIFCTLETYEISRAQRYAAISYAWGSPPAAKPPGKILLINGKRFNAWRNCCHALDQIRVNTAEISQPHSGVVYYWIDSICINQADLTEKAAQVQMMCSEIFPNAAKVFVSLESGFWEHSLMDAVLRELKRNEDPSQKLKRYYPVLSGDALSWEEQFRRARSQIADVLEAQKFWTRVWVLPELIAAKSVSILLNFHMLSWQSLTKAIQYDSAQQFNMVSPLRRVLETVDSVQGRISVSDLKDIIQTHSGSECSDTRDRIFAFWSMVDWPTDRAYAKVDYSSSSLQLIQDIVRLASYEAAAEPLGEVCQSLRRLLSTFSISTLELECSGYLGSPGIRFICPTGQNNSISQNAFNVHETGILVDVSKCNVARILTNSAGEASIGVSFRKREWQDFFNRDTSRHVERIELTSHQCISQTASTCIPFYRGAEILAWLCPGALVGDMVLEFEIGRLKHHLVIRECHDVDVKVFQIIGQAILSWSISVVPWQGSSRSRALERFSYFCIDISDVMSIAVPIYLDSKFRRYEEDFGDRERYEFRAAKPWPNSAKPTYIRRSLVTRNGLGNMA